MKLQISKVFWINQTQADSWASEASPKGQSNIIICSLQQLNSLPGRGKKRREDRQRWRDREGQSLALAAWVGFLVETCRRSRPSSGQYGFPRVHLRILPNIHHSCAQTKTFWKSQPNIVDLPACILRLHSLLTLIYSFTQTLSCRCSNITDPHGHQSDSQMELDPGTTPLHTERWWCSCSAFVNLTGPGFNCRFEICTGMSLDKSICQCKKRSELYATISG